MSTVPLIFTSAEHLACYKDLINKYDVTYCTDRKAFFYMISAYPNIRAHHTDCFYVEDNLVFANEDVLNHGWMTKGEASFMRLTFNLYHHGLPAAWPIDVEIHKPKRNPVKHSYIFNGLDRDFDQIAICGLYLWANRISDEIVM